MQNLFATENEVLNPELIQKLNDLYEQGKLKLTEQKIKKDKIDYSLPIYNAGYILDAKIINRLKETGSLLVYNNENKTFETLPIKAGQDIQIAYTPEGITIKSELGEKISKVILDNGKKLELLLETKASKNHDHQNYATKTDLKVQNLQINAKADKLHSHDEYALNTKLEEAKKEFNAKVARLSTTLKQEGIKSTTEAIKEHGFAKKDELNILAGETLKVTQNIGEEFKKYAKKREVEEIGKELNKFAKKTDFEEIKNKSYDKLEIDDLLYNKSNLIHSHNWENINGLQDRINQITTTSLGAQPQLNGTGFVKATGTSISYDNSTYLKIDGSNYMTGSLGVKSVARGTNAFDVYEPTVNTIGNVTSGDSVLDYGGTYANNYYNEGYSFTFRVYAYKTIGSYRIYSSSYYTISASDNSLGTQFYSVNLSWGAVTGASGYKIVVSDSWYGGAAFNFYFEVTGTTATVDGGYIVETDSSYVGESPMIVTPTSVTTGPDFNVDVDGNVNTARPIVSTLATGVAPLTVASTTKVSNLNVDQIDGTDTSTDGTFTANSDALIPTQKATKTYVDGVSLPFQYVSRTMAGTPTGEYADIGYWTTSQGAHNLRVTLSLNVNGAVIAKQYLLSTTYNQTAGAWQIVPVSKNTGYYGFDFHLIAYQSNANLSLRIVCFRNNNPATLPIKIRMENCGDPSDTFTSVATSGTMTVPTALVTSSTDYHAIGGGYMFTRAIPTTVGNYIEMCSLNGVNGNGATEMWVSNVDNGFVVSKKYMIPGTYNYAPNWCILAPITETGSYSNNDFAVVAIQNSTSITLRLLRTAGSTSGTAIITLSSGGDYASFFNEYSGTGSMAVPTIYHPATSITQAKNVTYYYGSQVKPYVAKTAAYTLALTDYLVNCTSGSFAITLPTAVGYSGLLYNIKNSGTGIISICTTSSQTLDAGNSKFGNPILNQYDEMEVMSNGANWIVTNRTNNNEVYNNEEIISCENETVYL